MFLLIYNFKKKVENIILNIFLSPFSMNIYIIFSSSLDLSVSGKFYFNQDILLTLFVKLEKCLNLIFVLSNRV